MDQLIGNIRYTSRQWRKSPALVVVALLTVAVGTAGITTMLSVTNAVLVRSLPGIESPEELVEVRVGDRAGRGSRPMDAATYQALEEANTGLLDLACGDYAEMSVSFGDVERPELVAGVMASGNLFSVLGTVPAAGRLFSADDDVVGRPVVVLSHAYWMDRFGGDRSVLGATLEINRRAFTVIGVTEEGFRGHLPLYDFRIFVPLGTMESLTGVAAGRSRVLTVGRLASGATVASFRAAADLVADHLRSERPAEWASTAFVVELHTRSFQEFRGPVSLLLGFLLALSGCILVIACANLAGVSLSQASARARELAVRKALGADRRRLVGQLLTESLLLFVLGGVLGLVLSFWATEALGRIPLPLNLPVANDFGPDFRVLVVSIGVTLVAGILFGLLPAFRATKGAVTAVIRDDPGRTPGHQRLRKVLVVGQIAGTVVLLGGSGVLFKALRHAGATDLGFRSEGVHVATLDLGIQQYSEEEGRVFFSSLLEEVAALPGVESAALADFLFLASPPERGGTFSVPGGEGGVMAGIFGVSPGFFETLGVDVLEGRVFNDSDGAGAEPVAIVNETVARILWPDQSAIGKTMTSGQTSLRVVGVARNGKYISIGESPLAGVFRPRAQHYVPKASVTLRLQAGRPDVGREVEGIVHALDPDVPLNSNGPYPPMVSAQLMPRRLAAGFAGALGLLGLFLASVGLFGVLSNLVARRLPEIALRTALGAEPGRLRRSILQSGLLLILAGLVLGIPASLAAASMIRGFLYGMHPLDPKLMAGLSVVFVLVGLAACFPAAMKATRTDPAGLLKRT